jgi:hypothetical protein
MGGGIIQIMPAERGLFVNTIDDCGNNIKTPVLCLALTSSGGILFIYLDSTGRPNISYEAAWPRG